MMQRWTTVALLAATLAGCVASGEGSTVGGTAEVAQGQTAADTCGPIDLQSVSPNLPKPIVYQVGMKLTPSKQEQQIVWVFLPLNESLTEVARVSVQTKEVLNVYDVKQGATMADIMGFVLNDNYGQAVYPGHPTPPPPVKFPWQWFAYANGNTLGQAAAQQAINQMLLLTK